MPPKKAAAKPTTKPLPTVSVFTDGGCSPNPGDGGWGVVLIDAKGRRKELYGGERATTNNRMEITAALMALRALKKPCAVTLTSDSQYVVKAFTDGWLDGWQRKGWRTASKEPVKNRDLWEEMIRLTATHQVTWVWTRGHSGHPENERCDELCALGRASLRGADGPTWFEQVVT